MDHAKRTAAINPWYGPKPGAAPLNNAATIQRAQTAASALFTKYGPEALQYIKNTISQRGVNNASQLAEPVLVEVCQLFEAALDRGLPWMLPTVEMKLVGTP